MKYSKIHNLKELRVAKGLTARELAIATGLSMQTIQSIEVDRVDITEIKLSTLTKLCLVLQTTPYQLFKGKRYCDDLLTFSREKFCKKYVKKMKSNHTY